MIPLEIVALSPLAPAWMARQQRSPSPASSSRRVRDDRGRVVEIGEARPEEWDALLAMYRAIDPAQRARGPVPLGEERLAVWVDELWRRGPNVVARAAGGRIVGHAAPAVPAGPASRERVVFVRPDYRDAGIERALAALAEAPPSRPSDRAAEFSGGGMMSVPPNVRVRLQGLVGAFRFAWIPFFCALVIALASEQPRGKEIALALAVASLCLGVAVHAREIVAGRRSPSVPRMSTGEWMARG